MSNPLVIIPSRMQATRLPNKPLADICGKPMIVRMVERALAANCGEVVVATDHQDIFDISNAAGAKAVMTDPDLPSGTDRVFVAAQQIDPDGKHDIIVNLQGDMPCFDPSTINAAVDVLAAQPKSDISTLVAPMHLEEEKQNDAVVKAVVSWDNEASSLRGAQQRSNPELSGQTALDRHAALAMTQPITGRALYFSRQCAPTNGPWWHHLGIYAFRRLALEKFIGLAPSPLEKSERLEQLRALENGMQIGIGKVDVAPLGVDTPETLEMARVSFRELR